MRIENAQWSNADQTNLIVDVDGVEMVVPTDAGNRHYAEILRQVEDGTITIQDADPVVQADEPAEDLPTIADLQKQIKKLEAAMKRKG